MSYGSQSRERAEGERLEARWWIKWWTKDTLYGSFGGAPLDELGFFLKLCCLSQEGRFPGYIQANEEGEGLKHSVVAGMLQIDIEEFERLMGLMKEQERISEDDRGKITINKFRYFQKVKGIPAGRDEAKAKAELEAGGVAVLDKKLAKKYRVRAHDQFTTPEENRVEGRGDKPPRPTPKHYTKPEEL